MILKNRFLLIAIACVMLLLHTSFRKVKDTDAEKGTKVAFKLSLHSFEEFNSIQGAPLSDMFNNVLSVKVVYEIKGGTLYFVNSPVYKYHYDFCSRALGDNDPLEVFNTCNYGNTIQRKYYLANINYYVQSHTYGLEFASEDEIEAKDIVDLYKLICSKTYLGDSLRLFVGSDYLLGLDKKGKLSMPKVYPADIYKGQQFQLLNPGVTYGILRTVEEVATGVSYPGDIVIMKGTPVNVPICAGIITNSYQTPLSHINILCHNRNIPSAVQVDVWNNAMMKANIGKPVRLTVNMTGINIIPVDMAVVDSFRSVRVPAASVKLQYDLSVKNVVPIKKIDISFTNVVGNKAAGVGELEKIAHKFSSDFDVPEGGFAIPFYFYSQHIANANIAWKINDLQKMQQQHAPEKQVVAQLKLIRKAIKEQPIDPQLMEAVLAMIKSNGGYKSFRFRSSANAEDVAGFSGAGLYESKTGRLNDTDKPIDMAIKKVWASAYDDNAYFERVASNIDEHTMMMGILVHRNFPDEAANGVAITKNIYRKDFPGFTVNVQVGEVPVVSPPDSVTCEQFICSQAYDINPLNANIAVDYITYSNINNNKPVLTYKQVKQLYGALAMVGSYYYQKMKTPGYDEINLGLDIEFKFDRNGKLYIKQARPYR